MDDDRDRRKRSMSLIDAFRKRGFLIALAIAFLGLTIVGWLNDVSAAQATASPRRCTDLIRNGGFEDNVAWHTYSANGYALLSADHPHRGRRSLYLAGSNDAWDEAWQTITAPVGSTFRLTYWWQVESWERFPAHDWLTVSLQTSGGTLLADIATYNDGDQSPDWQRATFTLTGALPPGRLRLRFWATTNDVNPTDFYIDDVAFTACQTTLPRHLFFPVVSRP